MLYHMYILDTFEEDIKTIFIIFKNLSIQFHDSDWTDVIKKKSSRSQRNGGAHSVIPPLNFLQTKLTKLCPPNRLLNIFNR